jgi:hypothetical protein
LCEQDWEHQGAAIPGIVQQAAASTVLPYSLASLFIEVREWPTREDGPYADGSRNSASQAEESRREWRLARKLTAAQYTALTAFYDARRGPLESFCFYPVQADHDPTGVSGTGRWLVCFSGPLSITHQVGRDPAEFGLVQVR